MTFLYIVLGAFAALFLLFVIPSIKLGEFLYSFSTSVESKIAKLTTLSCKIDGQEITYYDNQNNNKPTLLLLHGFSADKNIWLRFAKHFKDSHRVIIPDLLGHGETPYSPEKDYSSNTQANMIVAFVNTLKLEQVSIIGNSMGGMIGAILLEHNSSLFKRCVLLNPAGVKSKFAQTESAKGTNPFRIENIDEFKTFYQSSMAAPPPMPASVIRFIGQKNFINKRKQLEHQFSNFFDIDAFFEQPFKVDSDRWLIIWGELDGLLPVSDAQQWGKLTRSVPSIYQSIGHMPMVECPAKTAKDVIRFLD